MRWGRRCGNGHAEPHVDLADGRPGAVTIRSAGAAADRTGRASSQLTQRFAHGLAHRRHAPTHGMALEHDAERDRPEPAGRDVWGMMRAPPVTRHLAAIGARGLNMQPFDGARDLGDQVGPLACEGQCPDEQHEPVGSHHAIDHRARVGLGRARAGRRLLGTLGDVEDVATRGLDEQRLLGAEVVGDLGSERHRTRRRSR